MNNKKRNLLIIDRYWTLGGPATGVGAFLLLISLMIFLSAVGLKKGSWFLVGITGFFLSGICSLSKRYIALDKTTNEIKLSKKSFMNKVEESFLIDSYSGVKIFYSIGRASQTTIGSAARTWQPTQEKSYVVFLVSEKDPLRIKDFGDKDEVVKFQERLSRFINLPILESERV